MSIVRRVACCAFGPLALIAFYAGSFVVLADLDGNLGRPMLKDEDPVWLDLPVLDHIYEPLNRLHRCLFGTKPYG